MLRISGALVVSAVALALAVPVMAYTVVPSSLPQLNCPFNTSCTVTVTDMVSTIPNTNGGKIQSRIFQGQPGSPLQGKWCYEYRVNMTNAVGVLNIPYVTSMSIANFGPVITWDYNFDSSYNEQVFYINSGGIGSVGLASSYLFWGITFFNLSSPVEGGSYAGGGQSSYFFGAVSNYPPTVGSTVVQTDHGSETVSVYVPQLP